VEWVLAPNVSSEWHPKQKPALPFATVLGGPELNLMGPSFSPGKDISQKIRWEGKGTN
jgi:hypothetical protein